MNRIVLSPSDFEFGAGIPDGLDQARTPALLLRRTRAGEIDTSNDPFLALLGI